MEPKGFKHSKQSLLERFQKNRSNRLKELREENDFCDLILKSEDGIEIRVHKTVVASASNYFKDLLTLPMKEKHDECVSLPGITADILEKIIKFIYISEFEEKIADVEKIIKYAVIFQLEELFEICLLALSESINDVTCLNYWRLARVNLIYDLEGKCLAYITSKADYLFENSFLNNVTIDEMKSLLAQDSLHTKFPEQMIFEHVWNWAADRVTDTKKFSEVFSEVLDLFKFSELKYDFVYSKIFGNDNLLDDVELLKKIAKLTKVKTHIHMLQNKVKDKTPTGPIFHKKKLLGLASDKMFTELGEKYPTVQIEKKLPINFSHTTFGTNFLLICGGKQSSNCEYLDSTTQKWKKFPSMKNERSSHACSYLDNKIYVCGGVESTSVEIFDLGRGKWCNGPEMLSDGADFGLTSVNGVLYAFKDDKNVEVFDPRTQKWEDVVFYNDYSIARFPDPYTNCVANGSYIYCFNKVSIHTFDTRSHEMIDKIDCKVFDNNFSICEVDGRFYGFGYNESDGEDVLKFVEGTLTGEQNLKITECFDGDIEEFNKTALVALYY